MRFLTSYLTLQNESFPESSRLPCVCEAGFCSGNVNVVQVSHAPSAICAVPRNGVLVLQKTLINVSDIPVVRVQNAASSSSAFSCGADEVAMGDGLET